MWGLGSKAIIPSTISPIGCHSNSILLVTKWGPGGVAFVEIEPVTPPPTLGRVYLLTLPQLRCIAKGKNDGLYSVNITNEMLSGSLGTSYGLPQIEKACIVSSFCAAR